jgi:hypothetical protein
MAPTPEQLLLQLVRLSRALFDMRCAYDLTFDLERLHDSIAARAYGLYTGIAVSYARPFTASRSDGQGPLEAKWAKFLGQSEFAHHHKTLIDHRNTLLAHNSVTGHRNPIVWPDFHQGKPSVMEARAPINANGAVEARELFDFQEKRFRDRVQELAIELQELLGWKAGTEIHLNAELQRMRSDT